MWLAGAPALTRTSRSVMSTPASTGSSCSDGACAATGRCLRRSRGTRTRFSSRGSDRTCVHREAEIEFLVSHGYRHILAAPVLSALPHSAINLHISYLPWNRGAHPALWSVLEETPGAHDPRDAPSVDTGPVRQRAVDPRPDETSHSPSPADRTRSSDRHDDRLADPNGRADRVMQTRVGSNAIARSTLGRVEHLLPDGWDTEVDAIRGMPQKRT